MLKSCIRKAAAAANPVKRIGVAEMSVAESANKSARNVKDYEILKEKSDTKSASVIGTETVTQGIEIETGTGTGTAIGIGTETEIATGIVIVIMTDIGMIATRRNQRSLQS